MENFEQHIENKKLKKQDRLFLITSVGSLLIGLFFIILFILSLFYPKTNLQLIKVEMNGDEHISRKELPRGEIINFRVSLCKITDIPVEVTIELFDGDKDDIPLITRVSRNHKGCSNLILETRIPDTTPLGEYNVKITLHQDINRLRETHQEQIIPNLKVIEKVQE